MNDDRLTRARAAAKAAQATAAEKRALAEHALARAVEKRTLANQMRGIDSRENVLLTNEVVVGHQWPELAEAMQSFELVGSEWPEDLPQVKVHACQSGNSYWPLIAFDGMAIVNTSMPGHPQVIELQDRRDETGGSVTPIAHSEGVDKIELWQIPGLTLAEIVAMAEQPGNAVYPNLMYFPRSGSFVFHPGTGPVEHTSGTLTVPRPAAPASGLKSVLTVDTGMVDGDFRFAATSRMDPYPPTEAVHGHGPAIADLIGQLLGTGEDTSQLLGINHAAGAAKKPMFNKALNVRGFDLASLMSTLSEVDGLNPQVLNFSFGTLQCPEMAGEGDPLFRWLRQRADIMVAAAAGNHGEVPNMAEVPSWPAAYARPGNSDIELGNVVSVGSRNHHAGSTKSTSSGKGHTVVAYAQGVDVCVSRPGSGQKNGDYALWSGTSFATPQIAAELACGQTKQQIESKYWIK